MKIKYYLRGLGTGIIFTAIVLMIIYSYRTTDSKTMERARELGMVMPGETAKQMLAGEDKKSDNPSADEKNTIDKTDESSSKKETENNTQEQTTENNSEKDTTTAEPDTKDNAAQEQTTVEQVTEEPTTEEPTTEEPTTKTQTSTGKEITFTVSKGMYSESVSERLYELGVVDDATGFNSYLVQNGYAGRIRIGTYTLTTGMSYADVAAILSR